MQKLRQKKIPSLVKTMKGEIALPSLPEDVMNIILLMLPSKSILRFRCVCRLWLKLLKTPGFVKMHLNHAVENNNYNVFLQTYSLSAPSYYRVDFDTASASSLSNKAVKIDLPSSVERKLLIGSCNGILCFAPPTLCNSVRICLWNPCTQELKEIVKELYKQRTVAYGFGYDCNIHDYKLILIVDDPFDHISSEIQVYTLGSNLWKNIRNGLSVYRYGYYGHLLNGATHWLARKIIVTDDREMVLTKVIVSFDIAEETTKEFQIPSCFLEERNEFSSEKVGVLGKDLCFSLSISGVFELWLLKDYDIVDSWIKLLCIQEKMEILSIWRTLSYFNKNREILFSCSLLKGDDSENSLVSYDLSNGSLRFLKIYDMPGKFTAETFIGSLVSFNSNW